MAKKIGILIPTFNEELNVLPLYEALKAEFKANLRKYDYRIVFIDNCSKDSTRQKIQEICKKDKKTGAIFNVKNFGPHNSPLHGMLNTVGDCVVLMAADFQDPVNMISKFVKEWEKGYKIVIGIKSKSKENKLMYYIRTQFYRFIKKFSDVEQIEHFTGFGLYDRKFIEVLRGLGDTRPYLRGIISELGYERKEIEYVQEKRRAGKTSTSFYRLYDVAMLGITSYTTIGLRFATFTGFIMSILFFLAGLGYLIYKLLYWQDFQLGLAPMLLGIFFFGAVQLFFIGMMGEYILNINTRVMKRPLVVEEKRINF